MNLVVKVRGTTHQADVLEVATKLGAQVSRQSPSRVREIVEPVTFVIVGSVLLTIAVVGSLVERWRGGLVVDLRDGAAAVLTRDSAVPAGYIVVLEPGGGVRIDVRNQPQDALERLTTQLLSTVAEVPTGMMGAAAEIFGKEHVEELPPELEAGITPAVPQNPAKR